MFYKANKFPIDSQKTPKERQTITSLFAFKIHMKQ